jgi:hypothetical protein
MLRKIGVELVCHNSLNLFPVYGKYLLSWIVVSLASKLLSGIG